MGKEGQEIVEDECESRDESAERLPSWMWNTALDVSDWQRSDGPIHCYWIPAC